MQYTDIWKKIALNISGYHATIPKIDNMSSYDTTEDFSELRFPVQPDNACHPSPFLKMFST